MCIELDLRKVLPQFIWIGLFEGFKQQIVYEKLPKFCTRCYIQGHTYVECSKTNLDTHQTQALGRPAATHLGTPSVRQNASAKPSALAPAHPPSRASTHVPQSPPSQITNLPTEQQLPPTGHVAASSLTCPSAQPIAQFPAEFSQPIRQSSLPNEPHVHHPPTSITAIGHHRSSEQHPLHIQRQSVLVPSSRTPPVRPFGSALPAADPTRLDAILTPQTSLAEAPHEHHPPLSHPPIKALTALAKSPYLPSASDPLSSSEIHRAGSPIQPNLQPNLPKSGPESTQALPQPTNLQQQPPPSSSSVRSKNRKKVSFMSHQNNLQANQVLWDVVNRHFALINQARLPTNEDVPTSSHKPHSSYPPEESDSGGSFQTDSHPNSPLATTHEPDNSFPFPPQSYASEGEELNVETSNFQGHNSDDAFYQRPTSSKRNKRHPDQPLKVQLRARKGLSSNRR